MKCETHRGGAKRGQVETCFDNGCHLLEPHKSSLFRRSIALYDAITCGVSIGS